MSDTETLTTVDESTRSDDTYYIRRIDEGEFLFGLFDERMRVTFSEVSAYIEHGFEWADFGDDLTIGNQATEEEWPHWLFEEFSSIEKNGKLRPIDDYTERYTLSENRGIKGAE